MTSSDPDRPQSQSYDRLAAAVLALSFFGQLARFLRNRGLRYDECRLALNIIERDWHGLMQPLDFEQAAPIGFLWLERGMGLLFGFGELSLRFIPLLAAIVAGGAFWRLVREVAGPRAALIAVCLFAIQRQLLAYSGELKQYSTDVAVEVLLSLSAVVVLSQPLSARRVFALAGLGAVSLWLSHPAMFVVSGAWLAVCGSLLLTVRTTDDDASPRRAVWPVLAAGTTLLAVSGGVNYFVAIRPLLQESWTSEWWRPYFAPFPPTDVQSLGWYFNAFRELIIAGQGGDAAFLVLSLLFAAGLVRLFQTRPWIGVLLVTPALGALFASTLGRFGFHDRQILFLRPATLCLIAIGADVVLRFVDRAAPRLVWMLLGLAAAACGLAPAVMLARGEELHWNRLETRPVLLQIAERWTPGDALYVTFSGLYPFRYYAPQFMTPDGASLAQQPAFIGEYEGVSVEAYSGEADRALRSLSPTVALWVLTAQITWLGQVDVRPSLREALAPLGSIEQYDAAGVTAFRVIPDR